MMQWCYDAAESSSDWQSYIILWVKFSDHETIDFCSFISSHFQWFFSFPETSCWPILETHFGPWHNLSQHGRFRFFLTWKMESISLISCVFNSNWAFESQYVFVNLIPWMRHTHGMKRQTLKIWMLLGYRPDLIFNLDSITLFGKGCNNLGSQ